MAKEKSTPDSEATPPETAAAPVVKNDGVVDAASLLSPDAGDDGAPKGKVRRLKGSKNITHGIVYVKSTFNNTQVCVTDMQGNVISWSSSGKAGFRGSRKSTAYAASVVAQDAARAAAGHGLSEVEVRVEGPGAGRESAVRAVQSAGITVSTIRDITPVPHNGCRPRKRRRV
jgi:small subunit ribosomal protein S11